MKVKVKNIIDDKTFRGAVASYKKHSKYEKYIVSHKSYLIHFDGEDLKIGQEVLVSQSRPISKRKRWKLIKEGA